ncbi:HD domain-containing phosphohydrolase [Candidatus Hydrogenedentota bacterium]
MMNEKILFVDDDENILAAYRRHFKKKMQLVTSLEGRLAIDLLKTNGPFAVVISDMQMPVMDGVQFLGKVKEISPDSVRIMLTGNADLKTAMTAVNEGHIFRFLTKPCPPQVLEQAVQAAIRQYQLVRSERELLEKTLKGSVKILTDTLGLLNPEAFSRGSCMKERVKQIAKKMNAPVQWQYELAAMLSQIGCVTVPPEVMKKIDTQRHLTLEEQKMFQEHPLVGGRLLANIPRLEQVAAMIENQQTPFRDYPPQRDALEEDKQIAFGGQLLKVAIDFDMLSRRGTSDADILETMRGREGEYNLEMLDVLDTCEPEVVEENPVKEVSVLELTTEMIAEDDIKAANGALLVPGGQEITYPVLMRIRNFNRQIGVVEPISASVPATEIGPVEEIAASSGDQQDEMFG